MDRQLTDQIMVFKTNIRTDGDVQYVGGMLDAQTCITGWSIDIDDVDCVLRIMSGEAAAPGCNKANKHAGI